MLSDKDVSGSAGVNVNIDLEKLQAILADVDGKQLVEDVLNGSVKTMFSRLSFQLASADEWYLANDSMHINHLFDSLMMCMFLEPQVFNDFVHANPVIFDKAAPWFGGAEKLDGFLADAEASGWSRKGTARAFKDNVGGVNRIIAGVAIDVVGLIYGTGDFVGDVPAITGALASSGWAFATDPEVRATVGETLGALYQHMSEDPQGFANQLKQAGLDAWSASQLAHALEQGDFATAAGFVGPELVGGVLGSVKALQLASKLRKAKDGTTALAKTAPIGAEFAVKRYGPMNRGPLPLEIANTFRSGSYYEFVTLEPTMMYRVISDNGNALGGYWTRVKPQGPLQSVIDSALDQNWGNTATKVVTMEVPAGTRVFEGAAAAQRGLVGGGNQVYFDRAINPINPNWIKQGDKL